MSLFVKALPPGPKTYIRVGGGHLVTVTNTCGRFRYSSTLTDEGVYSLVVQSTEKKGERKSATVRARYALLHLSHSLVN